SGLGQAAGGVGVDACSPRERSVESSGNNSCSAPLHLEPLPDSGKSSRSGRADVESLPESGNYSLPSPADLESLPHATEAPADLGVLGRSGDRATSSTRDAVLSLDERSA